MVRLILAIVCLALFSLPAAVQERRGDTWVSLATSTVNPAARSLRLDLTHTTGRSKAIRVAVRRGNLILDRVVVTYSNGQAYYGDLQRPIELRAGQESTPFDLRFDDKFVDFVLLSYRIAGRTGGPIEIAIQALQSPTGRAARRSQPNAGSVVAELRAPQPAAEGEKQGASPEKSVRRHSRDRSPRAARTRSIAPSRAAESVHRDDATPSPSAAAARPRGAALGGGADGAVVDDKPYATVDVFFGTDRRREQDRTKWDRQLAAFGTQSGRKLALGKAVVTVPKQGRQAGQITRPEWDFLVARFSLRNEDLARDFTIFAVDVLNERTFFEQIRKNQEKARRFKDQAFIFVHGFNVSFDDALFRAAQIKYDVGFDGTPFVFSWPSIAGLSGYILDRTRAQAAEEYLRQFIELVERESGAKEIHLIAHSMGADPLLRVLRYMADRAPAGGSRAKPRFGEIILAAPDVTREIFEQVATRIKPLGKGITLYASSNDWALRVSQELLRGEPPAGWVPPSGPLVISGIDTIDVSRASTDFFSLNHSTFADREQLLKDLGGLLETGTRPPSTRLHAFKAVPTANGRYWRYEP